MLYLYLFFFLFFWSVWENKTRRSKVPVCHRVCDSRCHHRPLIGRPSPRAAEVERGRCSRLGRAICTAVRLSGIRGKQLQRGGDATTTRAETWTLHTEQRAHYCYYSGPSRTPHTHKHTHTHFIPAAETSGKVWRNAVSVPAPDQPAVCVQQPAGSPADGGLFVRSDAPAGRLLQLRHRWVITTFYCCKSALFSPCF